MKLTVIFVASLSHSGSTLLNLLLGNHPKLVGLGELDTVLQMSPARLESEKVMRCSCGERVANCKFWAPTISALLEHAGAGLNEKYQIVFRSFEKIYGDQYQIVDSSKYLTQLRNVSSLSEIELKVIHLLKDVRAFTISQRDAVDAEMEYGHLPVLFGSHSLSRWLYLRSIKTGSYLFWKWYLRNLATQKKLRNSGIKHMQIGYDELAQQPEKMLPLLYRFLKLELPQGSFLVPRQTNSHAFMGNQMLGDPEKMGAIRYDDRWKIRKDWHLAASLFPHISAYNAREVYSNSTLS